MMYPVADRTVSNPYGQITPTYFHAGVDFPGQGVGTPLVACRDFTIYQAPYWSDAGGWSVALRFDDGVIGWYQHMDERSPLTGGGSEGAIVGAMGNTGSQTTGPHLHFATYRETANGLQSFDPIPWLDQGIAAGGDDTPFPTPEDEEEDMSKNSGFWYIRGTDKKRVNLVCNATSKWWFEYLGTTTVPVDSNNAVAAAFDTGSYAEVTEAFVTSLKASFAR